MLCCPQFCSGRTSYFKHDDAAIAVTGIAIAEAVVTNADSLSKWLAAQKTGNQQNLSCWFPYYYAQLMNQFNILSTHRGSAAIRPHGIIMYTYCCLCFLGLLELVFVGRQLVLNLVEFTLDGLHLRLKFLDLILGLKRQESKR